MRRSVVGFIAALLATVGTFAAMAISSSGGFSVRVASETSTRLVLAWSPPSGALGYIFRVDGKLVSNTWDPARSKVTFGKLAGDHDYAVTVVREGEGGSVHRPIPVTTTAPTTTVTPPTGEIRPFADFADGTPCGDMGDCTQNFFPPHVTMLNGQGENGSNVARLAADDNVQLPNIDGAGQKHVRIHGLAFKGGSPQWFKNGNTMCGGISLRVPSGPGYQNGEAPTTLELHGDNGTGPAPLNLVFQRGGNWWFNIRGGSYNQVNPPGGFPFAGNAFGKPDQTGTYDGQYYRHNYGFAGLPGGVKPVILDEWVDWRMCWHLDYNEDPSTTAGWFELWEHSPSTGPSWVDVVPRKMGIPTSYRDFDGNGFALYPMMSLYYDAGGGSMNAVDVGDGAFSNDYATLAAWQDKQLGLAP